MEVLAGDIGGTKTWLALFQVEAAGLRSLAQARYASREHDGLEAMVTEFLQAHGARPEGAAFGIAGAVEGRRVRATNLPWQVDADALERRFGLRAVLLLNDVEALGHGIGRLADEQLTTLCRGRAQTGHAAVLAAGTGLGCAGLFWDGTRHRPFATEIGHTGFAPEGERERRLHAFVEEREGRVSRERVLSGSALPVLLAFVEAEDGLRRSESARRSLRGASDAGAVITSAALEGSCEACARALDLFVGLYGSAAADVALAMMARGGVYLGGGIAPKILPALRGRAFEAAFLAKEPMRALLETIPVRVVLDEQASLMGAADRAAWLVAEGS